MIYARDSLNFKINIIYPSDKAKTEAIIKDFMGQLVVKNTLRLKVLALNSQFLRIQNSFFKFKERKSLLQ